MAKKTMARASNCRAIINLACFLGYAIYTPALSAFQVFEAANRRDMQVGLARAIGYLEMALDD